MADEYDLVIVVTPNPNIANSYDWYFSTPLATIPAAIDANITMTLVAPGQPAGTCVFSDPPLTFHETWDPNSPTFTPPWYQDLQISSPPASTITFTDNNPNTYDRTYYFVINAIYTDSENVAHQVVIGRDHTHPLGSTCSPDPTIVNVGTDGNGGVVLDLNATRRPAEPPALAV